MNLKLLFRTIVFLLIVFAVLYVGMNNQDVIRFSFPLALKSDIHEPAALIYFGVFAVGVLGGVVLTAGGGKGGGGAKSGK